MCSRNLSVCLFIRVIYVSKSGRPCAIWFRPARPRCIWRKSKGLRSSFASFCIFPNSQRDCWMHSSEDPLNEDTRWHNSSTLGVHPCCMYIKNVQPPSWNSARRGAELSLSVSPTGSYVWIYDESIIFVVNSPLHLISSPLPTRQFGQPMKIQASSSVTSADSTFLGTSVGNNASRTQRPYR
jgi:hypothetical protein